jgi:hypothetical protein
MEKLRFIAYSMKNHDANKTYETNRLRGCEIGTPFIIFGQSIPDSEHNLRIVAELFEKKGFNLEDRERGSFTLVCDLKTANHMRELADTSVAKLEKYLIQGVQK